MSTRFSPAPLRRDSPSIIHRARVAKRHPSLPKAVFSYTSLDAGYPCFIRRARLLPFIVVDCSADNRSFCYHATKERFIAGTSTLRENSANVVGVVVSGVRGSAESKRPSRNAIYCSMMISTTKPGMPIARMTARAWSNRTVTRSPASRSRAASARPMLDVEC